MAPPGAGGAAGTGAGTLWLVAFPAGAAGFVARKTEPGAGAGVGEAGALDVAAPGLGGGAGRVVVVVVVPAENRTEHPALSHATAPMVAKPSLIVLLRVVFIRVLLGSGSSPGPCCWTPRPGRILPAARCRRG